MIQPEALKSAEFQPWSRGRGTDVWAMLCAARDGDVATMRALAAENPRLVDCEFEYRQPLHFAVRENRLEAVEFLLDQGVDATCRLGSDSPLAIAQERGYHELVKLLALRLHGAYHICLEGTEIAELIRNRDLTRLQETLAAHPELIHAADERGNQPIHWAVMTRQMDLIGYLLARGANVNARRPDGARPLDLTNGDYWYRGWRDVPAEALRQHAVLIGYLLARGAEYDISVAAKIGDVARVRALLDENPALVNEVPAYSTYYSGLPLRCAAGAGHVAVVKLLLERGANPNQAEGIAPRGGALREAIGGRHVEIVKLLLEHGADPNSMTESGGNCLWAAQGHAEISKLVASYGGAITFELACYDGNLELAATMMSVQPALPVSEEGLLYAMENGHQDLVALILRHRPEALRQVRLGNVKTPEYARWLMERGVDPQRTDWLGISPLHRFAAKGNREVAAVCLEFGADLNAVEEEHCSTPLGWAARDGQTAMVEWLLERGADRDLPRDQPWARPLEWARRRGHAEVARILQE